MISRNSTIIIGTVLLALAKTAHAAEFDVAATRRFLNEHCLACHGPVKPKGQVRLDRLNLARPTAADADLLRRVAEALVFQVMPPEDAPQPNKVAAEGVIAWIENTLGADGERRFSAQEKLRRPENGNYVDHATLFTEPAIRKAATPARLWRLDVDSFIARARRWVSSPSLFRDERNNANPVSFPYQGPAHTFLDYAGIHAFDKSTTEMLLLETDAIAEVFLETKWDRLLKQHRGDLGRVLSTAFTDIHDRPPDARELQSLTDLHERSARALGNESANRLVVQAMLLRPGVLFRSELGAGESDRFGRRSLSPVELAGALGFAVDVGGPKPELIAAVQKCDPNNRTALAAIVRPYLTTDALRDRLLRFAHEYFEYPRAAEVFKDADRHDYHPDRLVEDADAFVLRILADDRDVLRQWLTSRRYFVRGMFNYTGTKIAHIRWNNGYKDYHRNYNLTEDDVGKHGRWVDMPSDERAGLLTHPAWLLAFSDNEKNQAIQRGRWVTTKLLGGIVPDAPVEVDARLPEDKSLTLRENMRVTRAEQCWSCHKQMDPTGLPFEQYDLFGKFRSEEQSRPVLTTGEFWGREVQNPVDYVHALADSPKVRQVFLRHLFRFFLGRNETPDDAPTLIDMDAAYLKSGGSLKETVLTLLTSDSFVYRIAAPNVAARREPSGESLGNAATPDDESLQNTPTPDGLRRAATQTEASP
jgi:mono/diheme cytochrome c family protein